MCFRLLICKTESWRWGLQSVSKKSTTLESYLATLVHLKRRRCQIYRYFFLKNTYYVADVSLPAPAQWKPLRGYWSSSLSRPVPYHTSPCWRCHAHCFSLSCEAVLRRYKKCIGHHTLGSKGQTVCCLTHLLIAAKRKTISSSFWNIV